jgi:hypothetical protein
MVRGLDLFNEHFKKFSDQYILIGGAACDLAFTEAGVDFRATRDLDIVLCAEALSRAFVQALWSFIREGEYEIQEKSTGEKQFYRFSKPHQESYPSMLEFFSRVPDVLAPENSQHLIPIPVEEEVVSLSAILLDEEYYTWILNGKQILHGVPIVDPEHIIPLKARAWLDLTGRKAKGEAVTSKDTKKHKNDVFRLLVVISPEKMNEVPKSIRDDLQKFLVAMDAEEIDFKSLGLSKRTKQDVFEILKSKYGL